MTPAGLDRRRTPGIVNTAAAGVALALLLTFALRAAQQMPPAIAEFAPQAQHQIETAPPEQSSLFGNRGGGEGSGPAAAPSPSPIPFAGSDAILKHCVGDPPRQTEDPQSPPCVAYWQGDNGGATSPGVSRDTIWIELSSDCNTGQSGTTYNDLIRFFNKRFTFYNRTVKTYCLQSGNGNPTAANQRSDADGVAAQKPPPFAASLYRSSSGQYYDAQLACAHHIIAATYVGIARARSYLDACPGYLFEYPMDLDAEGFNEGQWACGRLVGRKAAHAAGNDSSVPPRPLASLTRKFGIIFQPLYADEPGSPQSLREQLAACGYSVADRDVLIDPVTDPTASGVPEDPGKANNAVLQMKTDNITSVFCICNPWTYGAFTRAADNQSYYPEWLVDSYGGLDQWGYLQGIAQAAPDQLLHTFGITFKPRAVQPQVDPYWMAQEEVDPGVTLGRDAITVGVAEEVYRDLLLIMSGLQMAGPHLTPQTFQAGLERAVFPNPDTPLFAGHVGFAGNTYAMTVDAAEFWYSPSDPSPYTPSSGGAVCYVDDGARHAAGEWPHGGDPFFKEPCNGVS